MTLTVALMLVRITGVLALVLGLLFWTGDARSLVPVHMLLGVLMVLGLWLLGAVASQMGAPVGMVAGAGILGLIVVLLGFGQNGLVPGGAHWVIQVVHLLVGMSAIGMAEMIGGRLRRGGLTSASTA
jgi:hypothetical protein